MKIKYLIVPALILSMITTSCGEDKKNKTDDNMTTMEVEDEDVEYDYETTMPVTDTTALSYNDTNEDFKTDLKNNDLNSDVSVSVLDVAGSSKDFSTIVAAAKAAGLETLLNADDAFTVFAPTNAAFDKLPEGTVADLLKAENKSKLDKILRYHVFMGNLKADKLVENIKKNNNNFIITSAMGQNFVAALEGKNVILTDINGNKSRVIKADTNAKNGVVHAINRVMMPNLP
ncbi:fasciclin domain-containing protein [Lacinutrix neustonica]|uniref:Fasciclin domain-containing protein n=1 Tax=Lacinutrix neustonica TaxID=2980107 RepID=A0A9E8SIA0_9FLAO|nr:fasciclin domain-containing protein [Lacinutrix neustonica]WAC03485.1 fasciclin domain-containing protein [Lacinutrix neustonica]